MQFYEIMKNISSRDIFSINSILWNYRDTLNVNSIFFHRVTNMKIVKGVSLNTPLVLIRFYDIVEIIFFLV